jgi:hypothetical protein
MNCVTLFETVAWLRIALDYGVAKMSLGCRRPSMPKELNSVRLHPGGCVCHAAHALVGIEERVRPMSLPRRGNLNSPVTCRRTRDDRVA